VSVGLLAVPFSRCRSPPTRIVLDCRWLGSEVGAGDYTTMPARSTAGPDDGTQRATVRPCGRLGTVQPREPAVTTARADAGRLAAVTADLVCGLLQAGEWGRYGPAMGILGPMLVAR